MAKVVVIDDRVTNRNILTRLALSVEEGLQVQSFASPVEALTRLQATNPPDLIITDYNMPEMDGATFIETLREQRAFADVPIVVVTVYEDRDFCYRALDAGATDFLLSPVDHLEFRARARNLLTMRRQQKMLARRAADLEQALQEQQGPNFDNPAARLQVFLDRMPLAISAVDRYGRLAMVNAAHEDLFAARREDLIGKSLIEAFGEAYATRHAVLDEKVLESGKPLGSPRQEVVTTGGRERDLVSVKAPVLDEAGEVDGVITFALDVSDLRLDRTAADLAVRTDRLTGLISASAFEERAEQELARARRQDETLAILVLDMDRFKTINEAFGKSFGDRLMRAVAGRLAGRLRETDCIARLRSDEFAILQPDLKRPDDSAELARRLGDAFAEPFVIEKEEVHVSASVGITLFPADGKTVGSLLKNADLAMYRAKASGRDAYRFFAAEMNLAARRAVTLERELRQALAGDQFLVYYQPQIDLASGRIVGMEALVRWNHPHRGIVRPGEFIGIAEDIGLIAPLTAWVLKTACLQHRAWCDKGLLGMQLSVNLSPIQFRERGVELMIERILKETGMTPSMLDIELTENAVIENSQTATASLRYLNELGVTLSIDDFGTGYSSLSYVKRLPVQRLKIDQSFVQNLEKGSSDEVIVRAIVNLGHSLGLRVIGEGVETEGQHRRLRRLGCDEVQGDFICPALSVAEFERRLALRQLNVAIDGEVADSLAGIE